MENFKHVLHQNLIKNCPVMVEDVTIAEKIYGPDISALKGKGTRPKVLGFRHWHVAFPQVPGSVTSLVMDRPLVKLGPFTANLVRK